MLKNVVAIASGKGGVGKSTVAANLAVWLANNNLPGKKKPLKVALIDVDFYGPSIPTIMGGGNVAADESQKIIPARNYNVDYISIAFFLKEKDDPIIWRGPRFAKAMEQLFSDVSWNDPDICIVDMPPGTGDSQLSLSQICELVGAVLVTTPQEVSVSDVRRAFNMFKKVNVTILGLIENMSGFKLPDGSVADIFGSGGGETFCKEYGVSLLGSIPIDMAIRQGGDNGTPIVLDSSMEITKIFADISEHIMELVEKHQKNKTTINIEN